MRKKIEIRDNIKNDIILLKFIISMHTANIINFNKNRHNVYYNNIKMCSLINEIEIMKFYERLKLLNNTESAFKYFNDYKKENYIVCYIYVDENTKFEFDENLYDIYHSDYMKFYSKNPEIKLLMYTNGKKGFIWCNTFMKFFNSFIYIKENNNDVNTFNNI